MTVEPWASCLFQCLLQRHQKLCVLEQALILFIYNKLFPFFQIFIEIPEHSFQDKKYPSLGIENIEDLPSRGEHRIPKIIHQTWKTAQIPHHYVKWMKSWQKNHPDWEFMFWTDESARKLIADKQPDLLQYYDGYLENIRRADALRYVILYEYGGVYADLDLESLRPLDDLTRKYSCILAQEPYEHPIIDGNFEHLLINAFMACRAKHPLMKKFMDNLSIFNHMWNVLDSTGPHFITAIYKQHMLYDKSDPKSENGVYIAPAEYFFPTIDPAKFGYMKSRCLNFDKLSYTQQKGCMSLKRQGLRRKPYKYSFTVHHWVHTYLTSGISTTYPSDVKAIIPHIKIYR